MKNRVQLEQDITMACNDWLMASEIADHLLHLELVEECYGQTTNDMALHFERKPA